MVAYFALLSTLFLYLAGGESQYMQSLPASANAQQQLCMSTTNDNPFFDCDNTDNNPNAVCSSTNAYGPHDQSSTHFLTPFLNKHTEHKMSFKMTLSK